MAELVVADGAAGDRGVLRIEASQEELDELQARLGRTRLSPGVPNDGWTYGMNPEYLHQLVEYWRNEYDWRSQEAAMNRLEHFRVTIDGLPIHYVHARGKGPKPLPLIISHGWPWTFWDYRKIIEPLADPASFGGDAADAFDVVIPSLPGYAFSSPLPRAGVNFWVTADVWATLMTDVLGYERWGAQGSDWGMFITGQLLHKYADRVVGGHVTGVMALDKFNPTLAYHPWSDFFRPLRHSVEPAARDDLREWERRRAGHMAVHMTDPQSVAHAFSDSPAGLAGWWLQRRFAWGDCHGDLESQFSKTDLLDNLMLYWLTNTAGSSVRYYAEATLNPWQPAHDRHPVIEAPIAFTFFAPDRPPGVAADPEQLAQYCNLAWIKHRPTGGHFVALEEPDAVVEDIREFFRPRR